MISYIFNEPFYRIPPIPSVPGPVPSVESGPAELPHHRQPSAGTDPDRTPPVRRPHPLIEAVMLRQTVRGLRPRLSAPGRRFSVSALALFPRLGQRTGSLPRLVLALLQPLLRQRELVQVALAQGRRRALRTGSHTI